MAVTIDGVLYVDNSTLSAFASCATKGMVRYGYNLVPEDYVNMPARAGIAIHGAIECYLMGGTQEEAEQILYDDYYEYSTSQVEVGDRLGYSNVRAVLLSWLDRNPIEDLPYKISDIAHVEAPFDFPLTDDESIRYVGKIDALVQRKDGADVWYVMDTKSTGMPDKKFKRQFQIGSQMTGYVWAAQQLFNRRIAGTYINIVHVAQIPTSLGICRTHKAQYTECGFLHPKHELLPPLLRSPSEIRAWHKDAALLAHQWQYHLEVYGDRFADVENVKQDGKWIYQQCALCELLPWCRAGRPTHNNAFGFVKSEWVPGDLQEKLDAHALK